MTPDKELEVIAFRESVKDCPYDDLVGKNREMLLFLCDSALRLAAIEAAGDEELESLHESFYKLLPLSTLEARRCGAFDTAIELLQERNATIADLRAKLGEAERFLKFAHESGAAFDTYNYESPEEKSVCEEWRKFLAESEVQGG